MVLSEIVEKLAFSVSMLDFHLLALDSERVLALVLGQQIRFLLQKAQFLFQSFAEQLKLTLLKSCATYKNVKTLTKQKPTVLVMVPVQIGFF